MNFDPYIYKAKVVKIVDGDTIDLNQDMGCGVWRMNVRLRIYNLDTPELRPKKGTPEERDAEKKRAQMAVEFTRLCFDAGESSPMSTLRPMGCG